MLSWVAARSRMAAGRGDWWEALWRGWYRVHKGVCGVGRACVQNGAGRSGSQGIDGGRVSRCSMSAGSAQRRVGCLSNWALGFWRGSEHSADDCLRFANPPPSFDITFILAGHPNCSIDSSWSGPHTLSTAAARDRATAGWFIVPARGETQRAGPGKCVDADSSDGSACGRRRPGRIPTDRGVESARGGDHGTCAGLEGTQVE